MTRRLRWVFLGLSGGFIIACSVIPNSVRQEAMPDTPFTDLVRDAAVYQDKTVIVGGYVLEVRNQGDATTLLVLQAPLETTQHRPKSRDLSKGRLILSCKGFLDPEVYARDRMVTAAGKVRGSSAIDPAPEPYPYLRVQVETLHLWPAEKPPPPDVYDDSFWFPYYRWRRPSPYWYR